MFPPAPKNDTEGRMYDTRCVVTVPWLRTNHKQQSANAQAYFMPVDSLSSPLASFSPAMRSLSLGALSTGSLAPSLKACALASLQPSKTGLHSRFPLFASGATCPAHFYAPLCCALKPRATLRERKRASFLSRTDGRKRTKRKPLLNSFPKSQPVPQCPTGAQDRLASV